MIKIRLSAFIDGFNLYHAIDDLGEDHLKWLNPRKLCEIFAPSSDFVLSGIFYFSAYATWRPGPYKRHREYIKALKAVGVKPILGRFKEKDKYCRKCGVSWKDHEEKETDVNIAIHMLREGFIDSCNQFLLISGDSDLAPVLKMIRDEFPSKTIKILLPYSRSYSGDLIAAAGGSKYMKKMKKIHLERSLFDREVKDSSGNIVAVRPSEYNPPT